MVYAPQRRHAVSSITLLLLVVGFMQYLYSPNLLILMSRILTQSQVMNAPILHPGRSLFGLGFMLTAINLVAGFLHSLDFLAGMNGGKGVILDFVGQVNPASQTRVLLLDLLIYIGQLVTLIVTYCTAHGDKIPQSASFPYKDYLLPPLSAPSPVGKKVEDDVEDDVESGLKKRRRRGFESAFEELDGEMDALWLNEDDGPGGRPRSSSRSLSDTSGSRLHEPPFIFSLTLPHIFHLLFSLPTPSLQPQAFAGGTPSPTPPVTPGVERTSPLLQPRSLLRRESADADSTRIRNEGTDGQDEAETATRMPGEFRGPENSRIGGDW